MAVPTSPRYFESFRAPRNHTQNQYHNNRSDAGSNEAARLSAQLMKTRNELEAERKKNANMRVSVGDEQQKNMDAALGVMTTDLLHKQSKLLSRQEKVDAKERDLQYREARIEQLEIYLSEGQKQAYRAAKVEYHKNEDDPTMVDINREFDRRQAELKVQKTMADLEGKFTNRLQGLQLREQAQRMREAQYKALVRENIEVELREKSSPDIEAKLSEVAELEYNNGFGAGKEAGARHAEAEARERGFLEGYGACHRTQVTLSKARQGLIAHDSAELNFLFDPAHPHNLYNMGAKLGYMEEKDTLKAPTKIVQSVKGREPMVQVRVEEPVRRYVVLYSSSHSVYLYLYRAPPPRPTFASELRGPQTMHNGQYVLANNSSTTAVVKASQTNGGNGGGRVGSGVYEGRHIRQYDDVEEEEEEDKEEGVNLIDLY
jgi:LmbE family N-acetylglucosaminyl deacetylase